MKGFVFHDVLSLFLIILTVVAYWYALKTIDLWKTWVFICSTLFFGTIISMFVYISLGIGTAFINPVISLAYFAKRMPVIDQMYFPDDDVKAISAVIMATDPDKGLQIARTLKQRQIRLLTTGSGLISLSRVKRRFM